MIETEQRLTETEQRLREKTEQQLIETEQILKELESRTPVEGILSQIFTNKPYFIKNLYAGTLYLDTDRIGGLTIGSHVRALTPDRSDFQKWILERSPKGYYIKSILGGYLTASDYGRGYNVTFTLTA